MLSHRCPQRGTYVLLLHHTSHITSLTPRLSIEEVNRLLDDLADFHGAAHTCHICMIEQVTCHAGTLEQRNARKRKTLLEFLTRATAAQHKWLIRIILKACMHVAVQRFVMRWRDRI